jgi:hypothetical protein
MRFHNFMPTARSEVFVVYGSSKCSGAMLALLALHMLSYFVKRGHEHFVGTLHLATAERRDYSTSRLASSTVLGICGSS